MAVTDNTIFQKNKDDLPAGLQQKKQDFPWWMVVVGIVILTTFFLIQFNPDFNDAFMVIKAGLSITISTTIIAYTVALLIGLLVGLGRVSESKFWRNVATIYVEIVRGVPLLVLIFFIALVLIPAVTNLVSSLGIFLMKNGLEEMGSKLAVIDTRSVSMNSRAIISLAITYGAFLAEIFRAGIQSINKGQMEAARSQGMNHWQAMRHVILPQAVRNIFPALGNDLISMLAEGFIPGFDTGSS